MHSEENHSSQTLSMGGSWIEINKTRLVQNIECLKGLHVPLGVVLKANAYGHGLACVLPVIHGHVDLVIVIEAADAQWIRNWEKETGSKRLRILVIGRMEPGHAKMLRNLNVEVAVGDDQWQQMVKDLRTEPTALPMKVHVQLDTGLGREGYLPHEVEQKYSFLLEAQDVLQVTGVMSHFANTEDVTEQSYALHQLAEFEKGFDALKRLFKVTNPTWEKHFSASAAALILPAAHYSFLRVGIALYGIWPSSETRVSSQVVLGTPPKIKGAFTWKCRSQVVKALPVGEYVGYGCTWKAASPTRIAVFPVGYFDGYPRSLSGKSHVLIRGKRCPVIGRVMMNHIVVDVGVVASDDSPLEAVLLGCQEDETISADLLASWAGTIPYEIMARVGSHLKRTVV
jgi:alanine racemase